MKAEAVAVSSKMRVRDGFQIVALACLKHFQLNEDLLVRCRDAEALHQARIAMRRLRSAFSLFRPALLDAEFEKMRNELRWFTSELGDARNLDVLIEAHGAAKRPGETVDLTTAREAAYDRVLNAIGSERFRSLMLEMVRWLTTGDWRSSKRAHHSLAPFAIKRLDRLWHRVNATDDDLARLSEKERHKLRIEAKKLRYATEFLAGVLPSRTRRTKSFDESLRALQECLGHLHDMRVAHDILGSQSDDFPELDRETLLRSARRELRRLKKLGPFWANAK